MRRYRARASSYRIRTTKPHPSPGQKPLSERQNAHFLRGKRAVLEKADNLERIEIKSTPPACHVQIAGFQGSAGIGHGQQRGSARTIDGVAAALEIELIANPPGNGVRKLPPEFLLRQGETGLCIGLESSKMRGAFQRTSPAQPTLCPRPA